MFFDEKSYSESDINSNIVYDQNVLLFQILTLYDFENTM